MLLEFMLTGASKDSSFVLIYDFPVSEAPFAEDAVFYSMCIFGIFVKSGSSIRFH